MPRRSRRPTSTSRTARAEDAAPRGTSTVSNARSGWAAATKGTAKAATNRLWQLPVAPTPLDFGTSLVDEDTPDGFVALMAWGPTAATADQLLYAESLCGTGVYLVEEGGPPPGEALVTFGDLESILGLAWLPDGSGFVYAVTDGSFFGDDRSANLYRHDLASGVDEPITTFVGDFAGQVSASGDGQRFLFERSADLNDVGSRLLEPDLWIVDRDGGGLTLLVQDA